VFIMRVVVLIVGILGVLGPGLCAFVCGEQLAKRSTNIEPIRFIARYTPEVPESGRQKGDSTADEITRQRDRFTQMIYFLWAAVPLGLFGAVLALLGRGPIGCLVMLLAGLGPIMLTPNVHGRQALAIFSSVLLIAAVLAIFVRPRRVKRAPSQEEEQPQRWQEEDDLDDMEVEEPPRRPQSQPTASRQAARPAPGPGDVRQRSKKPMRRRRNKMQMRSLIFGGIGFLWGAGIILYFFFGGGPQGGGAYRAAQVAGTVVGVLLFGVGLFYLIKGIRGLSDE
jgi:hypothetical protein